MAGRRHEAISNIAPVVAPESVHESSQALPMGPDLIGHLTGAIAVSEVHDGKTYTVRRLRAGTGYEPEQPGKTDSESRASHESEYPGLVRKLVACDTSLLPAT